MTSPGYPSSRGPPKPSADITHAREEQRQLALTFAHADAEWSDYRSALRWLQILEWLDGTLTAEHRELRERWQHEN